jgi:hypothetical protein
MMMGLESSESFSFKAFGRVNEFSDFPKFTSICVHLRFIFFCFWVPHTYGRRFWRKARGEIGKWEGAMMGLEIGNQNFTNHETEINLPPWCRIRRGIDE